MNELQGADEVQDDPEKVRVKDVKEVTETERLEKAAGEISRMEQLRPEEWAGLDETRREAYLRQVGQRLSDAYECPAPPFIGVKMPEVGNGVLLGEHSDPEYITRLNRELIQSTNPDEALRTYCHEFRHAYQQEMAGRQGTAFSHLCHDETQAASWGNNFKNYVRYEDDPVGYEAQPVERDAREFSDRMMEKVRLGQEIQAAVRKNSAMKGE